MVETSSIPQEIREFSTQPLATHNPKVAGSNPAPATNVPHAASWFTVQEAAVLYAAPDLESVRPAQLATSCSSSWGLHGQGTDRQLSVEVALNGYGHGRSDA